jgi:esterase/lipase superfamily enzyme
VRHLLIEPAELATADQLVHAARERLFGARAYLGQALVFVHGYNTSFDNAIRRAGQLAYDLGFDGPVFAFSWPSRERVLSYIGDRETAQLSADALREFIETVVAETKAKRIHIIAHSMGNVALNEALYTLDPATLAKLNIGEMVLASPDLDTDLFLRTFVRLQKRGATSTVYAASSDWALWVSSKLRSRPQLGYIPRGGPKRLVAGTDLIDITGVNSDVLSLNHDIYANSPIIIGDLKRLLKEGQRPPELRTPELVKIPAAGGVYWRYKAP